MHLAVKKLSFLQAMQGLIGRKIEPVSFQTRWGIHTFFLKDPIDILILDNNHRITKQKEKLQPNRIFLWNPLWQYIIELPSGYIKKYNITIGQKITIKETYKS